HLDRTGRGPSRAGGTPTRDGPGQGERLGGLLAEDSYAEFVVLAGSGVDAPSAVSEPDAAASAVPASPASPASPVSPAGPAWPAPPAVSPPPATGAAASAAGHRCHRRLLKTAMSSRPPSTSRVPFSAGPLSARS